MCDASPVRSALKYLHDKILDHALTMFWKFIAALPLGGGRRCVVCESRVGSFVPFKGGWKAAPPLLRALDVVGSDLDHYECPRCSSHDRERHLLLYMTRTGMLLGLAHKRVVHFAPELHLSRRIAAQNPADYVRCDLFPDSAEIIREDMLSMSFGSETVDVFIANHVLEHVDDDMRAMAEIKRVLKPGGFAILQTPFSSVLESTWEDPGIKTPEARLQAYGQVDHVRLYGRDIFERLASCGLVPRVQSHDEVLPEIDPADAGVNRQEPFFVFGKAP